MKAGLDPRLRAPPIVCASPVSGAKRCPGTSSCGLPPSAGASCSQRWARGARQRACFLVGCPMGRCALAFRWAEPAALRPRRRQARAAAPLGRISRALVALRRSGGRPARHAALARPPAQHAERAAVSRRCATHRSCSAESGGVISATRSQHLAASVPFCARRHVSAQNRSGTRYGPACVWAQANGPQARTAPPRRSPRRQQRPRLSARRSRAARSSSACGRAQVSAALTRARVERSGTRLLRGAGEQRAILERRGDVANLEGARVGGVEQRGAAWRGEPGPGGRAVAGRRADGGRARRSSADGKKKHGAGRRARTEGGQRLAERRLASNRRTTAHRRNARRAACASPAPPHAEMDVPQAIRCA